MLVLACGLRVTAAAAEPEPERDIYFMAAFSAGTGFGWASGHGDVNADTRTSGPGLDGPGHVIPEIGILSAQSQFFASLAARYQVIRDTTDVYVGSGATTRVFHGARSALAYFARAGLFLERPYEAVQPYVSFAVGWGEIRHVVQLPLIGKICGPQNNEVCVDTLTVGHLFLGGGFGLQLRLGRHLAANIAADTLFSGSSSRTIDANVGLAALF